MDGSKTYSEKDKKRDHDIIVFGMIQILYNLEKINRPTFEAIKKKMGSEIVDGELSQSYFEYLRAKIEARRNQKEDSSDTFGLMFMRVENGELMVTEACKQLNISRSTYYRQYCKWKAVQSSAQE